MRKLAIVLIALFILALVVGAVGCDDGGAPTASPSPALTPTPTMTAQEHNEKGRALGDEGKYDESIIEFTKAIELDSKYAKAYYNRGTAYLQKDDFDKAIADLSEAIELDPEFVEAYTNRGNAYTQKDNFDQAITDLTKAIELDPEHIIAYGIRGAAYFERGCAEERKEGDIDQARADLSKAIELDPNSAMGEASKVLLEWLELLEKMNASPSPALTPTPTPTLTQAYLTYSDEISGFSITYPSDWEQVPEELVLIFGGEKAVAVFWPSGHEECTANLVVGNEALPFPVSITAYFAVAKPLLRQYEGYTSISDEELSLGGLEAIKHVFTHISNGETMKQMFVCLTEGTTVWVIVFTTSTDCWDQYVDAFDTMADSFRLLE